MSNNQGALKRPPQCAAHGRRCGGGTRAGLDAGDDPARCGVLEHPFHGGPLQEHPWQRAGSLIVDRTRAPPEQGSSLNRRGVQSLTVSQITKLDDG